MRKLELWEVFAMAYFEGLMHGSGVEHERLQSPMSSPREHVDVYEINGEYWVT